MARPRSDEKRSAIMSAAARVIAAQGLGAATATIASEAGVSNGSLFTYFDTKADLLSQLYVELKTEMGAAALAELPGERDLRGQMLHLWRNWLRWAASCPKSAGRSRISAYRTTSRRKAERLPIRRWPASPRCWSGAAGMARCAMRRWRSSQR